MNLVVSKKRRRLGECCLDIKNALLRRFLFNSGMPGENYFGLPQSFPQLFLIFPAMYTLKCHTWVSKGGRMFREICGRS